MALVPWHPATRDTPSSVTQFAAALAALGLYRGANTPAEHAAEARRLGGEDAYRVRLANALLGAAQTKAILADTLPLGPEARLAAYERQFATAGAADSPARQIHSARWHRTSRLDRSRWPHMPRKAYSSFSTSLLPARM